MPTTWNQSSSLCCSCAGGWKASCEQQQHIKLESFTLLIHKVEKILNQGLRRTVKLSHATPGNCGQRRAANQSVAVGGMGTQVVLQLQKRGAGVDTSLWS